MPHPWLQLRWMPAEHHYLVAAGRQGASQNPTYLTGSPRYDHLHAASLIPSTPTGPHGGPAHSGNVLYAAFGAVDRRRCAARRE